MTTAVTYEEAHLQLCPRGRHLEPFNQLPTHPEKRGNAAYIIFTSQRLMTAAKPKEAAKTQNDAHISGFCPSSQLFHHLQGRRQINGQRWRPRMMAHRLRDIDKLNDPVKIP